ncbi:hypothetical protein LJY25_04050 [Hymenobacter sp. BT175]|uniref:hypothetical protein n=1 Tax=Hymenobacter translucens TaxID=2886507 RepID=UPI001D0DFD85|nr:hypothetical protein [Hymenobacter translucens]MCC2545605.1 hypothetical protein [Hymenobacter translucens]
MTILRCVFLLALLSLGSVSCSFAQSVPASPTPVARPALLTRADTVAALHELFQTKRQANKSYLVAVPITIGLTVVAIGVSAVNALSSSKPSAVPAVASLGVGVGVTSTVLAGYLRYTKGREREVIEKYEQKKKLPGWVWRKLAEQQAKR